LAKLRIIPGLLAAVFILTLIPSLSLGSHRSRASRSARSERGSRSRGRGRRDTRARDTRARDTRARDTRTRGRRGEHLSRSERRRSRRGEYASTRRGRRYEASRGRRHRVYYESRDSSPPPPRPASTGIPAERVTEIQRALIKEGYLEGQASGQYDDSTIAAMKQFQTHNSLPASGLPSAPALKKLGVAKRSNNGYAVPINSASEDQKKPSQSPPQVNKGKTSGSAPETNPQLQPSGRS
jgi:hypothetical protein